MKVTSHVTRYHAPFYNWQLFLFCLGEKFYDKIGHPLFRSRNLWDDQNGHAHFLWLTDVFSFLNICFWLGERIYDKIGHVPFGLLVLWQVQYWLVEATWVTVLSITDAVVLWNIKSIAFVCWYNKSLTFSQIHSSYYAVSHRCYGVVRLVHMSTALSNLNVYITVYSSQ